MSQRVEPLAKPYPDDIGAQFKRIMPPGAEPLALFTTLAKSPRHWGKFSAASLLDSGPLALREREIVIHRTTARCRCEYEWGIHAQIFAGRAGLIDAQLRSTVVGHADDGNWSEAEAALIATVDALIDRKALSDGEFARLKAHFDEPQIFETIQLVSFYHGVSLTCGALSLPLEPGAARFPTA